MTVGAGRCVLEMCLGNPRREARDIAVVIVLVLDRGASIEWGARGERALGKVRVGQMCDELDQAVTFVLVGKGECGSEPAHGEVSG